MLKRSNCAYLNGFSTTSPRKVSSSILKQGFSTTIPRKMIDMAMIANPEIIVNTPLVIAAAITGFNVGFGIMVLVLCVGMDISINSADILNAEFFPSTLDPFDDVIPEHLLDYINRAYADDADE
jgi:hypothetical protein